MQLPKRNSCELRQQGASGDIAEVTCCSPRWREQSNKMYGRQLKRSNRTAHCSIRASVYQSITSRVNVATHSVPINSVAPNSVTFPQTRLYRINQLPGPFGTKKSKLSHLPHSIRTVMRLFYGTSQSDFFAFSNSLKLLLLKTSLTFSLHLNSEKGGRRNGKHVLGLRFMLNDLVSRPAI